MIRLQLGDRDGARRDLARALAISPDFSIQHATEAARTLAQLESAR
jgi:Tfp pilus assembly protein PilF